MNPELTPELNPEEKRKRNHKYYLTRKENNKIKKRELSLEERKKKNERARIYYQENKERINRTSKLSHRRQKVLEYIRRHQHQIGFCNVCNIELLRYSFKRHEITAKHNKKLELFDSSLPVFTLIKSN